MYGFYVCMYKNVASFINCSFYVNICYMLFSPYLKKLEGNIKCIKLSQEITMNLLHIRRPLFYR